MATFYSDQITNDNAVPTVPNKPYAQIGRVRRAYWTYTTPAASPPGVADFVELVKVPEGAVIQRIVTVNEALSSAGGTAGADIGYSGADTRYGTAVDLDAAGTDTSADTIAKNFGDVLTAEKTIRAKVTGEAWAISSKFYGYVEYLKD